MPQPREHIFRQQLRRARIADLQLRLDRLHHGEQFVVAALLAEELEARAKRRHRTCWVRPWLQRRVLLGQYDTLMSELMRESKGDFKNYMRMEVEMFREMLVRISPRITKSYDSRPPLSPGLKLAVTLRFLATGNSYTSLAYDFRIAHNTISLFVPEVCDAVVDEYRQEQFVTPATPDEWRDIAEKFCSRWNLPHSCGALDGKHVAIRKPPNGGSRYYNYKGFHSIVIMALVDADYKFLWANVGAEGSNSDAAVFQVCSLRHSLQEGTLGLPPSDPLPGDDKNTPYFIVGDDAFPLREWLQKPYALRNLTHDQRIFNYRLSRARRVVENAFGILASRFRVMLSTMQVLPNNAMRITKGCLVLHNIMRNRYPNLQNEELDQDVDGVLVPGAWRNAGVLEDCQQEGTTGERSTRQGRQLRQYLTHYINGEAGRVSWQEAAIKLV